MDLPDANFSRPPPTSAPPPCWGAARDSSRRPGARRDLFPEGVASGDPDPNSVLLWTRRPWSDGRASGRLIVEVAEDERFQRIVASAPVTVAAGSDWTCRALVGGLKSAHEYWYRFAGEDGSGSRARRPITAPADDDGRAVKFAFVSCQNVNQGGLQAYRRMIFEDQRASPSERLDVVLHLGDFIYEIVWYPRRATEGCTIAAFATSSAMRAAKRSATFTCRRPSTTIVQSIARISKPDRFPRWDSWKRSSIASGRTIRCGRCFSSTGRARRNLTRR